MPEFLPCAVRPHRSRFSSQIRPSVLCLQEHKISVVSAVQKVRTPTSRLYVCGRSLETTRARGRTLQSASASVVAMHRGEKTSDNKQELQLALQLWYFSFRARHLRRTDPLKSTAIRSHYRRVNDRPCAYSMPHASAASASFARSVRAR